MTRHDRLLGRDRELALLAELVERVPDRGGALVVCGEPGIGKSSLLGEAGAHAQARGMRVLRASGVQSEANLPFSGLHQLLRPILGGADDLPAPQRAALLAAFGMSEESAPDRFLIALAVLDLVAEAAAETPHMLVVEDGHWLDASSAEVLAFVARRVSSDPIVLLVAVRAGFDTAFEDAGLHELRLDRLDEAASADVLDARAPGLSPAVRARVLDGAAGNPLALVELPVASAELGDGALLPTWLPLTTRLEQAFAARVAGLPTATRSLLLVAALDDGGVPAEVLAAATLVAGADLSLEQLTPAVTAQLVEVEADAVRFRHPLVRSAIHQSASVSQRIDAHGALARVLAGDPHRRVWHRAASVVGTDEDVAGELEATADHAQHRGGSLAAIATLERAGKLTGDPGLRTGRLLRAAELSFELGRRDLVARLLREVETFELAPLDRARVTWIRESFDDGVAGAAAGARSLAEMAERTLDAGETELAVDLLGGAALRCWWGDPGAATRERVVAVAARLPVDEADARLMAILAWTDPVRSGARVIARLARLPADPRDDGRALRLYGMAATAVGHHELAAGFLAAAVDALRADGRLALLAQALVLRGWDAMHLGSWHAALPDLEEGGRLAAETSQPYWAARARAGEAMLAGLRGEPDVAESLAAEVERVALPSHASAALADAQLARGLAALGAGAYGDAYDQLRRMFDRADPAHHSMKSCWAIGDLAEAAVHSGHEDAARALVAALEPTVAETPAPRIHVAMHHARALLAGPHDAESLYETALAADLASWPFARARLQLAFGTWLRRHRRVAESRAPLRAARDAFDALGVLPWGERARQELRASGESSRRRAPDARDELTPQELQIAQMAGDGLSNREIGQQLYLSHRTVGSHLYRVYPKLGITSRAELRVALEVTMASAVA
jgi:DNA-binding CsgD family transcriptional regulator